MTMVGSFVHSAQKASGIEFAGREEYLGSAVLDKPRGCEV